MALCQSLGKEILAGIEPTNNMLILLAIACSTRLPRIQKALYKLAAHHTFPFAILFKSTIEVLFLLWSYVFYFTKLCTYSSLVNSLSKCTYL